MNDLESRILNAIDLDGLIATVCELISYESCDGQEVAVQTRMAELLRDTGMETDSWEIELGSLRQHPAYGAEIERERAIGVVGRWGDGNGPTLILNGHSDVVPAGDLDRWTVPPFQGTVKGGKIYGRGAADMKGGLCCALFAVRALRQAGVKLNGAVMIQSVAGEEDGGLGTLATIERGHSGDAAIILEPTQLMIAPAQAGALSFRITIPGKAAHGALRYEGVDPMDHFAAIHDALRKLEQCRNQRLQHPLFADYAIPYAICVGKMHAGIWASTVAESLVMEGRYGVGIGEDIAAAQSELEAAIFETAQQDPWLQQHVPIVEWWGASYAPADTAIDHPIVTALAEGFEDITNRAPRIQGMPFGADMHLLVHQGNIPTVIFGPGDIRQAHVPDEFVSIDQLETATKTLALTILRYCT
jgi:acetylornithine deacetylase